MPKKRATIPLEIANRRADFGLFTPRKPPPETTEMAFNTLGAMLLHPWSYAFKRKELCFLR
jgi:hypothetical protein